MAKSPVGKKTPLARKIANEPIISSATVRPRVTPLKTKPARPAAKNTITTVKAARQAAAKVSSASTTKRPVEAVDLSVSKQPINRPWRVQYLRPEDFLSIEFEFVNLRRKVVNGLELLEPADSQKTSLIIVRFQPQSFAERAYLEDSGAGEALDPPPIPARISGDSRLVFRMPAGITSIRYTATALLQAMREFPLSVSPLAALPKKPTRRFVIESIPKQFASADILSKARAAILTSSKTRKLEATKRSLAKSSGQIGTYLAARKNISVSKVSEIGLEAATLDITKLPEFKIRPPELRRVLPHETALELPWRLILSPNVLASWVHATAPVKSAATNRTELWHTRLGTRIDGIVTEDNVFEKTVRAIDSPDATVPDYKPLPDDGNDKPFMMSITPIQRHNIVHLSSNNYIINNEKKKLAPIPVNVSKLELSSLGSTLDSYGQWDPLGFGPLKVISWRHISRLARDHYVKIIELGFYFPFHHRAALISVTERKFQSKAKGNAAYLRKRQFLVTLERIKVQGSTNLKRGNGEMLDLQMPFKQTEILTETTPLIDDNSSAESKVFGIDGQMFWPRVNSADYPFHMRTVDLAGNVAEFTTPLLFVSNDNYDGTKLDALPLQEITNAFSDTSANGIARRRPSFDGQVVQFAKATADDPDAEEGTVDTAFETEAVQFTMEEKNGALYPIMASAAISIAATKYLLGENNSAEFTFPSAYLKNDIDGSDNKGQLFLKLLETAGKSAINFSKSGDRSGGLLQPSFSITGISRLRGPIGGSEADAASATFTPASFFDGLPADALPKLFGCIPLTELIGVVGDLTGAGNLAKAPQLITEQINAAQALYDKLQKLKEDLNKVGNAADTLFDAAHDAGVAVLAFFADPTDNTFQNELKTALTTLHSQADLFRKSLANLPQVDPNLQSKIDRVLERLIADLANATDFVNKLITVIELVSERRLRLEWTPHVDPWPKNAAVPLYQPKTATPLVLAIELQAASSTHKEASFEIRCTLEAFQLNLLLDAQFMRLHFKRIEFLAASGRKPDVTVDFDKIEFVGVLSFIQSLKSLIPLDGFSDPPNLVVDENGIEASFSLALPNIAIGVFSLSNLSLGASFTVPFIGDPLSVRFNFCERHNPFMLTVWVFGGGGFFAVTVTPAGVQILEAAFEFGACAALEFGVASGSVKVVAGIYFKMEGDEASLTGYFRLNGKVDVLGLISASIELYLELEYEFGSGKCVGRATLTIEVEVLFFSASVEISCEKKFAGSNGDPTFIEMMSPYVDPTLKESVNPWNDYCSAFAS